MDVTSLKWVLCNKKASNQAITETLQTLQKKIPALFMDMMKLCDGGCLKNSFFEYYDVFLGCVVGDSAACFLGFEESEYSLLCIFKNPPELLPKDVIAFAETGGGDLICFDYRQKAETDDPPVVFWSHEASPDQSLSPIAPNFEAFLSILKRPPDDESIAG